MTGRSGTGSDFHLMLGVFMYRPMMVGLVHVMACTGQFMIHKWIEKFTHSWMAMRRREGKEKDVEWRATHREYEEIASTGSSRL